MKLSIKNKQQQQNNNLLLWNIPGGMCVFVGGGVGVGGMTNLLWMWWWAWCQAWRGRRAALRRGAGRAPGLGWSGRAPSLPPDHCCWAGGRGGEAQTMSQHQSITPYRKATWISHEKSHFLMLLMRFLCVFRNTCDLHNSTSAWYVISHVWFSGYHMWNFAFSCNHMLSPYPHISYMWSITWDMRHHENVKSCKQKWNHVDRMWQFPITHWKRMR